MTYLRLSPRIVLLALGTCLLPSLVPAITLHVSPSGNDSASGTAAAPLLTPEGARDQARRFAGREPVEIIFADGTYHLPRTWALNATDSGTAAAPIVYRAAREGGAVLSGGTPLRLDWTPWRDGIWRARVEPGLELDQLFIDGRARRMARFPDFDPAKPTEPYQGWSPDAFAPSRAARWADPAGGFIHAMHSARWGGYHYRITGKKPDGTVAYEGGWQNNRQMGMHKKFRMVENIFEELDAPGEWFHDRKEHWLYFFPPDDVKLATALVEAVRLRHLVEISGSRERPARHLALNGFVFRHAARTFMDNREPLLRSDWTLYRGGALVVNGAEDITLADSEFDQVGGNAVMVTGYARRVIVRGCHIHDAGASGVVFAGLPSAVRDPLFEYAQTRPVAEVDRTPGPKSDDYPADCIVEDSLIHGIGRVERQASAVQIAMAARITVRDTSIYDCSRAGINIGDGTWGGHLIEGCDVFDTVLETHDHGSFNSWGRDRYWAPKHREHAEKAIQAEPGLPFLDAVETTVIRHSRWRCDHGWDIDLDDGSSNYDIHHNLLLAGGLKLREGFRRRAWNNVIVNNGLHPHVWFADSRDEFTRNIVMRAHAPVRQPENWGAGIDRNLFTSETDLLKHRAASADAHSVSGDPLFVDSSRGDYRVRPGSSALDLGFENFPMDRFGVKKPSLRSLARTPVLPSLKVATTENAAVPAASVWRGLSLEDVSGPALSAYGASFEAGGVAVISVAADSPHGGSAGLRAGDLIQAINGTPVRSAAQLRSVADAASSPTPTFRILRQQRPLEVGAPPPTPAR